MANLTGYNPFDEMVSLREAMDRLFAESFISPVLATLDIRSKNEAAC